MLGTDEHAVDEESRQALRCLLATGRSEPIRAEHLCGPQRTVSGRLVGGNLTILASLAGTPEALHGQDALVVLEDVAEAPYRLERSLGQLVDSGAFVGAAGILLGEFAGCDPAPDAGYVLPDIWRAQLERLEIPMFHRLPIGHGKRNVAFRYGSRALVSAEGTIVQA
jgi:muramoyltetrapeptide carboxypeptidase